MAPSHQNWPFVINVGNSIIGVTVLAMPFCFQTCGIFLGMLLLFFSSWLTIVSCQILIKAGVTSRRRCFSLLAYYTHGATGKLMVEIGMIGLQLGTLVAQVVVIGDLGPDILSKMTGLAITNSMRTGLIMFLCLFVGLPLGLLKDIRTLSRTSTICILFYAFFTLYVVVLSVPKLVAGDWYNHVNFWRMEGFFKCLPIFSFAFGCQTQLFIVYDALSEPSLKRINSIVSSAVNMCTLSYMLVGFFGYIAFYNVGNLSGDIINHFKTDMVCDIIKLCFVIAIAVSIPLIVFPCRASLYTLCFPQKPKDDLPSSGKIPELHFKVITVVIIVGSMIIAILIPNIEFVLGLNGATMGCLICYIFPALFFLNVMSDKSEGLFTGRVVLAFGLIIMIASTFTILRTPVTETKVELAAANPSIDVTEIQHARAIIETIKKEEVYNKSKQTDIHVDDDKRHEPPIPQEPIEVEEENKNENAIPYKTKEKLEKEPDKDTDVFGKKTKTGDVEKDKGREEKSPKTDNKDKDAISKEHINMLEKQKQEDNENIMKQKQEKERERELEEKKKQDAEKKQDEILAKLEHQQQEQEKLIQEQKQILEQLKEHKEKHEKEVVHETKQLPADDSQKLLVEQGPVRPADLNVNFGQPVQQGQGIINLQAQQQQQQHQQLPLLPQVNDQNVLNLGQAPQQLQQGNNQGAAGLGLAPQAQQDQGAGGQKEALAAVNLLNVQPDSAGNNIEMKIPDRVNQIPAEQKILQHDNVKLGQDLLPLVKDNQAGQGVIKMEFNPVHKLGDNVQNQDIGANVNNDNQVVQNIRNSEELLKKVPVKNDNDVVEQHRVKETIDDVDPLKHRGKRELIPGAAEEVKPDRTNMNSETGVQNSNNDNNNIVNPDQENIQRPDNGQRDLLNSQGYLNEDVQRGLDNANVINALKNSMNAIQTNRRR